MTPNNIWQQAAIRKCTTTADAQRELDRLLDSLPNQNWMQLQDTAVKLRFYIRLLVELETRAL